MCGGPSTPGPAPSETSAPATRIVSLVPSFTEIVVRLGAGDRLVGIGRFDPEVPGRPDLPRLGDMDAVNLESLVALEPDVVLVNSAGQRAKLEPVAGRMRVVRLANDRLEDALRSVAALASLVGREAEGARLVEDTRAALEASRRRAGERRLGGEAAPRVLVVVQRRPFYTAGARSYLHDLLTAVGAQNVTGDLDDDWPMISEEAVVARAPDVILDASIGDGDDAAGRRALLEGWQRFATVPAVRTGRVFVVKEDALFRAGSRIPEALAILERLLFAPSSPEEPR